MAYKVTKFTYFTYKFMNNNFEQRLNRFNLSDTQKEKYTRVYQLMQEAASKTGEELQILAEHIAFAGLVKGNKKLILSAKKADRKKLSLYLLPVAVSEDLLKFNDLSDARLAPQMRSLGIITVYKRAYADEEPHLTRRDVLAQIPMELADRVSAFCLHLEEDFVLSGYNLIVQAYEYHIELFAKL